MRCMPPSLPRGRSLPFPDSWLHCPNARLREAMLPGCRLRNLVDHADFQRHVAAKQVGERTPQRVELDRRELRERLSQTQPYHDIAGGFLDDPEFQHTRCIVEKVGEVLAVNFRSVGRGEHVRYPASQPTDLRKAATAAALPGV